MDKLKEIRDTKTLLQTGLDMVQAAEDKLDRLEFTLESERRKQVEAERQEQEANEIDELFQIYNKKPSPNFARKTVIEQAKDYVSNKIGFGEIAFGILRTKPEFIVNREKRTVVVLLRGFKSGIVRRRGVAKAAPEDVFNVHIGKAIALQKALGKVISYEFAYAPQPEEAEVGDVVRWIEPYNKVCTLTERASHVDDMGQGKAFYHTHDNGWLGEDCFNVIDDTKEEHEGGE
ncbi:hypothetical protein [Halobacillus ihumii]|uniref:hypothetical protein n=1 Tax=Halobacillus ihumii TaxID=2686092 RepID=UPI0013D16A53|nr:hypothetical protein [Halobacillus ihumii]